MTSIVLFRGGGGCGRARMLWGIRAPSWTHWTRRALLSPGRKPPVLVEVGQFQRMPEFAGFCAAV